MLLLPLPPVNGYVSVWCPQPLLCVGLSVFGAQIFVLPSAFLVVPRSDACAFVLYTTHSVAHDLLRKTKWGSAGRMLLPACMLPRSRSGWHSLLAVRCPGPLHSIVCRGLLVYVPMLFWCRGLLSTFLSGCFL